MSKIFLIAEIGINHNGNVENAIKLIDIAKKNGFDAVKFQKRNIKKVFSPEDLDKPRETPFGKKNIDLKLGLEFEKKEYDIIDSYCKKSGIEWFASPWDLDSFDFLITYKPKFMKIASALITAVPLVEKIAKNDDIVLLSDLMSATFLIADSFSKSTIVGLPIVPIIGIKISPLSTFDRLLILSKSSLEIRFTFVKSISPLMTFFEVISGYPSSTYLGLS